jgi:hypothetical protein
MEQALAKLHSAELRVSEQEDEMGVQATHVEEAMARLQESLEAQWEPQRAALAGQLAREETQSASLTQLAEETRSELDRVKTAAASADSAAESDLRRARHHSDELQRSLELLREEGRAREAEFSAAQAATSRQAAEMKGELEAAQQLASSLEDRQRVAEDKSRMQATQHRQLQTELDAAHQARTEAMAKAAANAEQIALNVQRIGSLEQQLEQQRDTGGQQPDKAVEQSLLRQSTESFSSVGLTDVSLPGTPKHSGGLLSPNAGPIDSPSVALRCDPWCFPVSLSPGVSSARSSAV